MSNTMTNYSNVSSFQDRHGVTRHRFRRGTASVYLPGQPGEYAFEYAYAAAIAGEHRATGREATIARHYGKPAIKRAKTRAKVAGVPMWFSEENFSELMNSQGWKCAVSGIEFPLFNVDGDRSRHAFRPSLDRIVPRDGYVPGNVRIVCEIVNLAMNDWGEAPLRELVRLMHKSRLSNRSV